MKLKPCPFCGACNEKVIIARSFQYRQKDSGEEVYEYSVFCRNCGVETYAYDTKEEAAAAWNRRDREERKE